MTDTKPTGTLLNWLGKDEELITTNRDKQTKKAVQSQKQKPKPRISAFPDRVVLGVLGTRSNTRVEDVAVTLMAPLIEAWGTPDELLLPSEGDSSIAIQTWAATQKIPVRLVSCDWVTQGRRAGMLRDARIQREASHLLLLQGPRSNTLSTLATRLSRKGCPVVISERPGLSPTVPGDNSVGTE
jgi:hypothetical protein